MDRYRVKFVSEADLPLGHDWAMAQTCDGVVLFAVERRLTPTVLEEAWSAFRLLAHHKRMPLLLVG